MFSYAFIFFILYYLCGSFSSLHILYVILNKSEIKGLPLPKGVLHWTYCPWKQRRNLSSKKKKNILRNMYAIFFLSSSLWIAFQTQQHISTHWSTKAFISPHSRPHPLPNPQRHIQIHDSNRPFHPLVVLHVYFSWRSLQNAFILFTLFFFFFTKANYEAQ